MTDSQENPSDYLPLREPTYFILLSLASGQKHGYAIMKDVEELSLGKLKLSTSTLYEALARLLDQGLILRVSEDEPAAQNAQAQAAGDRPGRPRKEYSMSAIGRWVLDAETARMQALIAAARGRVGGERI